MCTPSRRGFLFLLFSTNANAFTLGSHVSRRVAIFSAPFAVQSTPAPQACAFDHELTRIEVSGVGIPVAVWRPARINAVPASTYPYRISIGKIAAKLKVNWLSWLPTFNYALSCGTSKPCPLPGFSKARDGDTILFAHGFLGSVYDFAHAAEALAADGFTVVAPELPESLTASYIPTDGLQRQQIIAATRNHFGESARWGIFGHSAGAGSALLQDGRFQLGRAAFAGGARIEDTQSDPVFLCSSNGDGCNRFMASGFSDLRQLFLKQWGKTAKLQMFDQLADAYSTPAQPPQQGVFVFAADNTEPPLPCHISFLWCEVNDAMCTLLRPFLPLAQLLGLFVLDFDVYLQTRDAEKTAAQVVPALRRFFLANAAK